MNETVWNMYLSMWMWGEVLLSRFSCTVNRFYQIIWAFNLLFLYRSSGCWFLSGQNFRNPTPWAFWQRSRCPGCCLRFFLYNQPFVPLLLELCFDTKGRFSTRCVRQRKFSGVSSTPDITFFFLILYVTFLKIIKWFLFSVFVKNHYWHVWCTTEEKKYIFQREIWHFFYLASYFKSKCRLGIGLPAINLISAINFTVEKSSFA